LYWRLRRRLFEERVKRRVRLSQAHLNDAQIDAMLYRWYNARADNADSELVWLPLFMRGYIIGCIIGKHIR
jgi:hypothetical protein